MGIRKRIKDFRNWCPQPPDRLPAKLKSYSAPIAVVLAAALIFGVSFSLFSSEFTFNHTVPQVPVIETTPKPSPTPTATPIVTTPTLQTNVTSLSKDDALSIAMPIIDNYTLENNRTITSVNESLSMMADDGFRGGPSVGAVLQKNLSPLESHNLFDYYPVWIVTATFEWTMPQLTNVTIDENGSPHGGTYADNATWIYGYDVIIWADNGQVYSSVPQGVC